MLYGIRRSTYVNIQAQVFPSFIFLPLRNTTADVQGSTAASFFKLDYVTESYIEMGDSSKDRKRKRREKLEGLQGLHQMLKRRMKLLQEETNCSGISSVRFCFHIAQRRARSQVET